MKRAKKLGKVISGIYVGRIGWVSEPNHLGNVMFYPLEDDLPCRVCLSQKFIITNF